MRHLTTSIIPRGAARAAFALIGVLASGEIARAQPDRGAQAAAGEAPGVVFFWCTASAADQEARATLAPAVDAAARRAGHETVDLSPAPAPALALAEDMTRALGAYDAMRFPDAIAELDRIAAAVHEHGGRGLARDGLVDLFLYRGLARSETGETDAAWADFVRAATLDPARVLDPARFRPSALKSFARAVDEVRGRPAVTLSVAAPAGSRVHIDGREGGEAAGSESILPGEHFVWVERPAAPPFARTVTVTGATTIDVPEDAPSPPDDADLRRRAARLGARPALLVALRRDGGAALVELRTFGARGGALGGVVRLGRSPESDARAVAAAVARALRRVARPSLVGPVVPPPGGRGDERRWYDSRWLWLAVGAASAVLVVSPFLLDSGGESTQLGAGLDTGALRR